MDTFAIRVFVWVPALIGRHRRRQSFRRWAHHSRVSPHHRSVSPTGIEGSELSVFFDVGGDEQPQQQTTATSQVSRHVARSVLLSLIVASFFLHPIQSLTALNAFSFRYLGIEGIFALVMGAAVSWLVCPIVGCVRECSVRISHYLTLIRPESNSARQEGGNRAACVDCNNEDGWSRSKKKTQVKGNLTQWLRPRDLQ